METVQEAPNSQRRPIAILLSFPTWPDVGFREKTRGWSWEFTRGLQNTKSTAVGSWRSWNLREPPAFFFSSPRASPLAQLAGGIPVEMRVRCRVSTVRSWPCVFVTPARWMSLAEEFTIYATMPSPVVVVESRWIFVIFHPVEDTAPFCVSRTISRPSSFWRIGWRSILTPQLT